MAGKEGTVAPRERVNIVYKSSVGDAQEEVELPLRFVMLGDYTGRQDSTPLEDRKPIDINKDNFNDVLRSQNVSVTVQVANKLAEKEGEEMPATLKFSHMKDFEPESVVCSSVNFSNTFAEASFEQLSTTITSTRSSSSLVSRIFNRLSDS